MGLIVKTLGRVLGVIEEQIARLERHAVHLLVVLELVDDLVGSVNVAELERTALHRRKAETEHGADVTLSLMQKKVQLNKIKQTKWQTKKMTFHLPAS